MEEEDKCQELSTTYSQRLRDCISRCLEYHPEDRHDAFDLLRISELAHETPPVQVDTTALPSEINYSEWTLAGLKSRSDQAHKWYREKHYQKSEQAFTEIASLYSTSNFSANDLDYHRGEAYCMLGIISHGQGKNIQAEDFFRLALPLCERTDKGRKHLSPQAYYGLSLALISQKKFNEAEGFAQKAFDAYKSESGTGSSLTVGSLYCLAMSRAHIDHPRATETLREASKLCDRVLGPDEWRSKAVRLQLKTRRRREWLRPIRNMFAQEKD